MATCAQMTTKSTANSFGGEFVGMSWHEISHPHIETKSAEEILTDVATRAGIVIN